MPESPFPAVPESIEGFRIGARLRESGALVVHAGTSRLDLPVEVFLARADALTGGFEPDDFVAGVRRAAAVHHEALLPFVTGGVFEGFVFAVAKSLDGRTLEEIVAKDGPLDETKALRLAAAVAGALSALEQGGARHGDLAPQRILAAGVSAWVVRPPRLLPAALSPRAERWQAPEEARGSGSGVQSDQFVLGLVLAYALTGSDPLGATADGRRALRDWKSPDLESMLRRASPETRAVTARLLAPEPANRFATAADAQRALLEAANDRPETAPIVLVEAPPPRAPVEPAKRTPGRLYVDARLGESMLEIDDDEVFVGAGPANNVRTQSEKFAGAALRVERTVSADVIHAVEGDVRVNGRAATSQPLADGDRIEAPGIAARYECATRAALRSTRPAAAAAPGNPLAGAIAAVAVLATIAALGWGAWRVMGASKEAEDAKVMATRAQQLLADEKKRVGATTVATPATVGDPLQVERAARDAYEAAAHWARRRPNDARTKFYETWQRFPDTAYGLLARFEALEIDRRTKPAPDKAVEELLAAAEAPDGYIDPDTLSRLRSYVEDHAGTLSGERAHFALVRSQAIQRGRFDADIAAVRAAVASKDWREAKILVAKILDYVPPNLRDEVLAERRRIDEGMGETMRDSPSGKGDEPRGEGPGARPGNPPAKPDEPDRNAKAEELFRNARKLMESGKDVEALEGFLTFLRDYKDTVSGTKFDPEARGRVTELSRGPAGVVKLFRGKVEKLDSKGRWKITYDFEDPAQFQDFRDVNAFDAPPRAVWKVENGAVKNARGSGVLALDAVFSANEVAASVVARPKKPHDLGVMFMDPTEERRFYLFTIQNTFFTLGRGDAAQPFLENAIVLFGPNMWRDTPPGQLGFVRKCGSDTPQVHEMEATPIRAGKSEGEVWMKFEGGRSIRGSAYGDQKYEFPGVTPGLFVLRSEGSFDEFSVEGVPDFDWVQKRWRAILSGL